MSFVAALAHNRIVFGTFRIFYQPLCGLLDYWYETRSTLSSCQFAALTINILTHVPSHVIATLITSKKPAPLPVTHQTSHIALFVLILRYQKLRFSPSFRQQGMIIGKGGESIKVPSWVMGCKASKNRKMWQLNFVDFSFLRCQTEFLGCFWECSFGLRSCNLLLRMDQTTIQSMNLPVFYTWVNLISARLWHGTREPGLRCPRVLEIVIQCHT